MSSILTNVSAMSGLSALRGVNTDLATTQDRISSGLKVQSGADNAAYFSISETMKGDNSMLASIEEGLTLTRNSVSTARLGAETVADFAQQIADRVAFAQGSGIDRAKVQEEIDGLVKQVKTTIEQSTFNGDDIVNASKVSTDTPTANYSDTPPAVSTQTVVTGVSRGDSFGTTSFEFGSKDLAQVYANLDAISVVPADNATEPLTAEAMGTQLSNAETTLGFAVDMATSLGITEKTIENQQNFLGKLQDNFKEGIGSMVDANMEEEAAKLKSLQVQQQLANTALSISNSAPQQLLSLFR